MATIHFNEQSFAKAIIEEKQPAIIDFWAPWCGPCQAMGPVIDELAKELDGKMLVGKLDIEEYKKLAIKHKVMSIPTVVLFRDGVEQKRLVGLTDIAKLRELAE